MKRLGKILLTSVLSLAIVCSDGLCGNIKWNI